MFPLFPPLPTWPGGLPHESPSGGRGGPLGDTWVWRNVWLMSLYREGAAESWKAGAVSQAETTRDSPEPTSEKPGLRGQRSKRAGGGGAGGLHPLGLAQPAGPHGTRAGPLEGQASEPRGTPHTDWAPSTPATCSSKAARTAALRSGDHHPVFQAGDRGSAVWEAVPGHPKAGGKLGFASRSVCANSALC